MRSPVEPATDFWRYLNDQRLNGTLLYYQPFLQRKAHRCAAAVATVARAKPGGIIFHCGAGRDCTGLLTLLLLALVDVDPEIIAADYDLTTAQLRALYAAMGRRDEGPLLAQIFADQGTTAREATLATLEGFNVEEYLLAAGLDSTDLARVRSRLLS